MVSGLKIPENSSRSEAMGRRRPCGSAGPAASRSAPWRAGADRWCELAIGQIGDQGLELVAELVADAADLVQGAAGRVGHGPLDVAHTRVDGAVLTTAHGHHDVS